MTISRSPVRLYGAHMNPIWSGHKLSKMYASFNGSGRVGESWETSTADGSDSYVLLDDKEMTLRDYLKTLNLPTPPLVKLLDAGAPLSIQVHPDDTAADKCGGVSKSEAWYVLNAEPGATIIYGASETATDDEVRSAIYDGNIETLLSVIPVKKGDFYIIPPGMIHSLGAGVTVLEVQNRVGTTYRVKDIAGNREIHPKESAESFRSYSDDEISVFAFSDDSRLEGIPLPGELLVSTKDYVMSHYTSLSVRTTLALERGGVYMFCEHGGGVSEDVVFTVGDSLYFPYGNINITTDPYSSLLFVV